MDDSKATQDDVISRHVTAEIDEGRKKEIKENLAKYEQLFGADEDAFVQPTTTRKELWSYYLYYNVSPDLVLILNDTATRMTQLPLSNRTALALHCFNNYRSL
jgi:hypothetical protein